MAEVTGEALELRTAEEVMEGEVRGESLKGNGL